MAIDRQRYYTFMAFCKKGVNHKKKKKKIEERVLVYYTSSEKDIRTLQIK